MPFSVPITLNTSWATSSMWVGGADRLSCADCTILWPLLGGWRPGLAAVEEEVPAVPAEAVVGVGVLARAEALPADAAAGGAFNDSVATVADEEDAEPTRGRGERYDDPDHRCQSDRACAHRLPQPCSPQLRADERGSGANRRSTRRLSA